MDFESVIFFFKKKKKSKKKDLDVPQSVALIINQYLYVNSMSVPKWPIIFRFKNEKRKTNFIYLNLFVF